MTEKTLQLIQLSVNDLKELISNCLSIELEKANKMITSKSIERENELLSREETSKLLKVSFTTLFNWNRNGKLEAKKLGNKVFYLKSEVFNKINNVA